MATALDAKQIVPFEELLVSQVVQQEALTRLLIEKGIFTKEEFFGDGDEPRDENGRK